MRRISRLATYMERIPHVVARGGTLQGNIKTQPGMANVLTARANRGEMLVFNWQNVIFQIVKMHSTAVEKSQINVFNWQNVFL